MRVMQFINELSSKIANPLDELAAVDRYIAKAGLRDKGVGRNVPDVTTVEAMRVVVAVLCSRTPPQAVPDLRNVEEEFRLMAQGVKVEEGDVADLQRVIGLNVEEIENRNPIEVFAKVAQHVATPSEPHTKVSIKVELAGPLTLQVNGDGFRGELIFGGDEAEGDCGSRRIAPICYARPEDVRLDRVGDNGCRQGVIWSTVPLSYLSCASLARELDVSEMTMHEYGAPWRAAASGQAVCWLGSLALGRCAWRSARCRRTSKRRPVMIPS